MSDYIERIKETRRKALEHYGHDPKIQDQPNIMIGYWQTEMAAEKIKKLPDFMEFVDDAKRLRITFDYDPDYPIVLFITETEMKQESLGEAKEADHSDV